MCVNTCSLQIRSFIGAIVGMVFCFTARAAVVTSNWISTGGGDWATAANWSTSPNYPNNGTPLGSEYQAAVNNPGAAAYTVTLQNSVAVDGLSLASANATVQQSAGTLSLQGTMDLQAGTYQLVLGQIQGGRIQSEGGAFVVTNLYGSGGILNNVTLAAPISLTYSNPLNLQNTLTLDGGSITMTSLTGGGSYYGSVLNAYSGAITVNGTGNIIFNGGDYNTISPSGFSSSAITIGPNVTISTGTGGGTLGGNSAPFINQGTINVTTSSLALAGKWTNPGTINLAGGSLSLGGTFATSDIGHLVRTGGGLLLTGTLSNTAQVLDLSSIGSVALAGTINGGTITAGGSASSLSLSSSSTLNGVTLDADLSLPAQASYALLTVANGITLLNGHMIRLKMGGNMDLTSVTGSGQVVVDGVPNSSGYQRV